MKILFKLCSVIAVFLSLNGLGACKKKTTNNNNQTKDALAIYKKIYGATDIYLDGDFVVIKTTGISDHKSPYYKGTAWESSKFEDYNGSNSAWKQNPNTISQMNYTFRIPLNPKEATIKTATPMGPMGVSLNGIPIFNQYAAGHVALSGEINSFDQYNGHPAPGGDYHYHLEPTWLTTNNGKSALLGFLLDGFPVYGPLENGKTIVNGDLDVYHGHTCATADYPNGIYHYHITSADPYINGDAFFGTAGTVSK